MEITLLPTPPVSCHFYSLFLYLLIFLKREIIFFIFLKNEITSSVLSLMYSIKEEEKSMF